MENEDYKDRMIELIRRMEDEELIKSLFWIIQKLCRGF